MLSLQSRSWLLVPFAKLTLIGLLTWPSFGIAAETEAVANKPRVMRDLTYRQVGDVELKLDLFLASEKKNAPAMRCFCSRRRLA